MYTNPLTLTKNQIIKKLKADNEFTLEGIKELISPYTNYIFKRGDIYDLDYSPTKSDRMYNKIRNLKCELLGEFDKNPNDIKSATEDLFNEIEYSNLSRDDKPAIRRVITELSKELTATELINIDLEDIEYETSANEYISISVGASVWTYYVEASLVVGDRTVVVDKISYDSEVNGLTGGDW